MDILILEDQPQRQAAIREWLDAKTGEFLRSKDKEWVAAIGGIYIHQNRTAKGAIRNLKNKSFDLMFLDHDLGVGPGNSGMHVVNWLLKNNVAPKVVVIHSMNTSAAHNMESKLTQLTDIKALIRAPFPLLDKNFVSEIFDLAVELGREEITQ